MFTVKKTHENDHVLLRSALRIGLGRPPGGGGGGCRCFSGFIYLVKSRFWRRQNSVVNYLYCSATLDLCSFAFLLARADPFFFFAGICIVYARTHTRTTVQISVQANGTAYDDPEWRLRRGDSPLRHRRRGGHHMHTHTHTNTHSLSSLPDGNRTEPPQAQSPPAHTDPIAPSVPRSMVGKHLAEGGPKRNRRAVIWISRRFWSGFFF